MEFLFPLTVDNLAEVPAEYQPLYVAAEDGEGGKLIDTLAKKMELSDRGINALNVERRRAEKAERALRDWKAKAGVETPDDLAEMLTTREREHEEQITQIRSELGDGKDTDVAKRIDAAKEEANRKHAKEIERLTGEIRTRDEALNRMRTSMEKNMREEAAVRAIASKKGNVRLLKPHVIANTKVVEEDGEWVLRVIGDDGEARYDGDGKFMSVESLVDTFKGMDEFSAAFDADGASGGGTRKSNPGGKTSVRNPWAKENFNLSEQMRIQKENPTLANSLRASAGVAPSSAR